MQQHQHILFMDIETVPVVKDYSTLSDTMQAEWQKKSRFFIKDDIENADYSQIYSDRAGVYAEFAKVVCIGFGSLQQMDGVWQMRAKTFADEDEHKLLTQFVDMLARFVDYNKQMVFCGHNIKEFDIPFLCRRMLINKIPIPPIMNLSGKKPWENPHIDTLELWKFGDYKNYTSLALLAEILGIPSPKDDIDGSMVASVFYEEKNLPRISKYCLQDVVTSAKVFLRLKGEDHNFETTFVDN